MTKQEFKSSKEFAELVHKIKCYKKGFKFTIPYYKMTKPQINAMNIVTQYCVESEIIESVEIGLDITGNRTEETFRRL